jgi:hypothetical protein
LGREKERQQQQQQNSSRPMRVGPGRAAAEAF